MYVFDRVNGQLLLTSKLVDKLTWASGIGADDRPQMLPKNDVVCPVSATNWMSTAFSPKTNLYYVSVLEDCNPGSKAQKEAGQKYLRAYNIETGSRVWSVSQLGPADGKRWAGVLATEGGLVFYGDASGAFVAAADNTGQALWHFDTNTTIKASPMTYIAAGRQYVAIAAGSNIIAFRLPAQ